MKPTKQKPWFLSSPDDGLEFFATEKEAEEAAKILIKEFKDTDSGGWDEEVEDIFVGCATQITEQFDHWEGSDDCMCNYKLIPINVEIEE